MIHYYQTFLLVLVCTLIGINDSTKSVSILKNRHEKLAKVNPYILECTQNVQCQDIPDSYCFKGDFNDDTTWHCTCWCEGAQCTINRDCCSNNCTNQKCAFASTSKGSVCYLDSICAGCGYGFYCHPWPKSTNDDGYCDVGGSTTTLPRTPKQSSRSTGATEEATSQSAQSVTAEATSGIPTTQSVPMQSTQMTTAGITNPWTYIGCPNGQSDCQDTVENYCFQVDPTDPSTWFCSGQCDGGSCKTSKDCANNDCERFRCSTAPGTQGTLCWPNGLCSQCAANSTCNPWPPGSGYGYCA